MPEVSVTSDNTSLYSITTTSVSTAAQVIHIPPRQLRQSKTATQLKRWVSKRMSRSSMADMNMGHELSEQNLKELNTSINKKTEGPIPNGTDANSGTRSLPREHKRAIEVIDEIAEENHLKFQTEKDHEVHVRRSYAAFCEDFTLSGQHRPKRMFDITMAIDGHKEEEEQINLRRSHVDLGVQTSQDEAMPCDLELSHQAPSKHKSIHPKGFQEELGRGAIDSARESSPEFHDKDSQNYRSTPTHYPPHPPSPIMTPSLYREMQRAAAERNRARKQRLFRPIRSLFHKMPSLRGRRCDLSE